MPETSFETIDNVKNLLCHDIRKIKDVVHANNATDAY